MREYSDIFSAVDRKAKIYTKTGSLLLNSDMTHAYQMPQVSPATPSGAASDEVRNWPEMELQRGADRMILARYAPAGLVIDDRMNVLQARGDIAPYLDVMPGAVSWNLSRVLRDNVYSQVRQAVQHSVHEHIPASASFSVIDEQKGEQQIHVDVLPVTNAASRQRCFLVLFQKIEKPDLLRQPEIPAGPVLTADEKDRVIAQLRQDLMATRFHMQSLVEERDARNQELVCANEEIQSSNEELQSTNEELETTKEELQSANEELQTVNEELQQRNSTLAQTGNDLTNLLNSVNIPLLMLTSDLNIRQFTPPMQRLLNVRPSDIGRSISEIRLQLSVEDIAPILHDVLETLGTRELEVQDREGKWFLMRVRPYRTSDNKIEGLVLVLLDIDQLRSSQQSMLEARDFAQSVLESVPVPVVVLSRDCTVRTVNTEFRELTQMSVRELTGRSLPDLMQHLWGLEGISGRLEGLLESNVLESFELEHRSTTSDRKTLLIKAQALSTGGDRVLLLMMEDITLRRQAEQMLAQQKTALESEIEQAARNLDRTQEELRSLTAHLFSVQQEERQRVSRELHDDIAQRLSFLELLLNEARSGSANEAKIEEARKQLATLSTDVRAISHQLHPAILDDLGLSSALKALVDEFGAREGMPASYISRDLPEIPPQPAATAIYRITQEGLRNVAKHAGKTHVKVILEAKDNKLHLEVRDMGIGFDQEFVADGPKRGLGLITMQERARLAQGRLNVTSGLGEGTTIAADIPFERHA